MFLKNLLFKPNFIAVYREEEIFKILNEQYKKNEIIFKEKKEFDNINLLKKYISSVIQDNPQTYVSTVLLSPNQGAVPGCGKQIYKQHGIETENIKSVCINNKYSFYTTLYELMEIKKTMPFTDFIYPAFAIIDFNSSLKNNSLYILVLKEFSFVLIYKDGKPLYSDIFVTEEETENDEEIEDISDMDIIEDFDESLDEDIDNIEELIDTGENIENINVEYKITEHIKSSLKEYYDGGGDFVEKIFIFDTIGLEKNITDIINDELFIQSVIQETDILKTINDISRKNV
ncbi:hypothetical protein [Nautilia sp.]